MLKNSRKSGPCFASRFSLRTCRLALVVFVAVGTSGCSRPSRVEQVARGEAVDPDTFLHEHLQGVPMVTVGEAYRALLLLADGDEKTHSFEERQAELQARGLVRAAWNLQREQPIDRGSVAFMVLRIIQGPRGVNSLVWGNLGLGDRRYALRDLVHMGLIGPGGPDKYLTGGELVFLMGKADKYMADRGRYPSEKVDLRKELAGPAASTRPAD